MTSNDHAKREPPRYSATRVKTFDECRRKWHLQNVHGWVDKPEPQKDNPAFAWGSKFHKVAEDWLKLGRIPPNDEYGRAFRGGVGHWPSPKAPGMRIEERFSIKITDTLRFRGVVDVLYAESDGSVTVGDHKTTSNLGYAMTPDQLLNDVQAIAYGYYASRKYEVKKVNLQWVYYCKKTGNNKCVRVTKEVDYFLGKWKEIVQKTKLMLDQWTENRHPKDIEGDLTACGNYGGCEFRNQCDKLKGENTMSIESLLARQAQRQEDEKAAPAVKKTPVAKKATKKAPVVKKATAEPPLIEAEPVVEAHVDRETRVGQLLCELILLLK